MNLRVTPNFNTQNNRQNPNFKMRMVEPQVAQHIASKLGRSLEDALEFVSPVSSHLADELGEYKRPAELYIGKSRNGCSGIYYSPLDVKAILEDRFPVHKLQTLIQEAAPITKEEVDAALSEESIQALSTKISSKSGYVERIKYVLGVPKNLDLTKEDLKRFFMLKFFLL